MAVKTINRIFKYLFRKYPQNFIIAKPVKGSLIIMLFCLAFILLYKPLDSHSAKSLSYLQTMIVYCSSVAIPVILLVWLIKKIKFFSNEQEWTLLKELVSVFIILTGIGTMVYFMAFLIEEPAERWNFYTYLDSCLKSFLICFIPLGYFTLKNYKYLLYEVNNISGNVKADFLQTNTIEKLITINSKLKNEALSFYPSQFIYAISDGNYVIFNLYNNNKIKKETIRNSIKDIEEQLSDYPYFCRTHRAFIINIKKVIKKNGNSLGYKLDIEGIENKIPVSRQKIKLFDKLYRQYC